MVQTSLLYAHLFNTSTSSAMKTTAFILSGLLFLSSDLGAAHPTVNVSRCPATLPTTSFSTMCDLPYPHSKPTTTLSPVPPYMTWLTLTPGRRSLGPG